MQQMMDDFEKDDATLQKMYRAAMSPVSAARSQVEAQARQEPQPRPSGNRKERRAAEKLQRRAAKREKVAA